MNRMTVYSLLIAVVSLTQLSCESKKLSVPTGQVIGNVKWDGTRPTDDLKVIGIERGTNRVCDGKIEPDGRCQLLCGSSENVPEGTYDLAIARWEEPMTPERYTEIMKNGVPKQKPLSLPKQSLDPKKSGWNVVVAGGESTFEITVPTK